MKNRIINYKRIFVKGICTLIFIGGMTSNLFAQDTPAPATDVKIKPVKNTFEGALLIDNQTVKVNQKNTLEFDIQHRFGLINNGYKDMYGFFAPSNIRLGVSYAPINNLMLGIGICKDRMQWDGSLKYALLKQNNGMMPVSLTYYGNIAIDTRGKENFVKNGDRVSYFHSLMLARKITKKLSLQVSGNYSHFNNVEGYIASDGTIKNKMKNDHLSFSCMGRFKITDNTSLLLNYDQPLTQHPTNNPRPNISFGIEMATSAHQFQVFMGNYQYIVPQYNNMYNQNNYAASRYVVGFNITRLWSY